MESPEIIFLDEHYNNIIASWNVNSLKCRITNVINWLKKYKPLVLTIQEVRCDKEKIDRNLFWNIGYEFICHSKGGRNGVAIIYRDIPAVKILKVKYGLDGQPEFGGVTEERVVSVEMEISKKVFNIYSIYVPNGRTLDDPHFAYKIKFLECLEKNIKGLSNLILTGDFNVSPRNEDVWSMAAFKGCTHVTPEERNRIAALGLRDVIPEYGIEKDEKKDSVFTFWGYIGGLFWKDKGMRIDLILTNSDDVTKSYVDRNERREKGCSDHTPLVAYVNL